MKSSVLKKGVSLLLCAAVIACAAGCGSTAEPSEAGSSSPASILREKSKAPSPVSADSEEEEDTSPVPKEWRDEGIFSHNYEKAYTLMKTMTLEEKVGQILLARCPDVEAAATAYTYQLGGYVLFDRDFTDHSKDEVTANNNSYLLSPKIPMIIAVDEEGGTVSRLSGNPQLMDGYFSSPRELYALGGLEALKTDTLQKSQLLKSLKINTNLAPVCDISRSEGDFMYYRSLGESPEITADCIREIVRISQANGISATLKHFPGYGNNVDTHTGIAIDNRTMETFRKNDFLPFAAGIEAGAHMVLVSHNIVECMDPDRPASLSGPVHEVLRKELGFTGIIVTDDLVMDAISKYASDSSPAVQAVLAGNDMLCVSDIETAYQEVLAAVHSGVIETDLLDHAVMRILSWKMTKGMIP